MSRDDYWDRIDDDNRYADYKYDQRLFEQDQYRRTTEVYDALRERNYDKAAWTLGVTPNNGSDTYLHTTGSNERIEFTVEGEVSALIQEIRESTHIPFIVQLHWIEGLEPIPKLKKELAKRRISDFKAAFHSWKKNNRPQEDIWDIGNTRIWLYDSEMLLIDCKIDRVKWLVTSS